jgi:hypothetical protein
MQTYVILKNSNFSRVSTIWVKDQQLNKTRGAEKTDRESVSGDSGQTVYIWKPHDAHNF